ncbi:uncharacterized protein LOC131009627 [Salvia miltiorrhiza]|uniref:uncharacterized protein LOC131009627 n=1 Tax=Salvia miltiorrhiza TaxID=226208 RepID=UPI0025ABB8B9|nr:uncharacterized protein LOC131009627 [Salvia miltiorrhiza]
MEFISKRKILNSEEQNRLAHWLLANSNNGRCNDRAQKEAASMFGIGRRTVRRFWSKTKEKIQSGAPVIFSSSRKGVIHKDRMQVDVEKVKSLSILERSTIRKMAVKLGVSKSLLGNWIKRKELRPHTNAIKPLLTDVNKIARMKYCLSNVVYDATMARPQFSADGQELFDGKIGIFPFTTVIPAIKEKWPKSAGIKHIIIQQDNARPHFNKDDPDFIVAANSDGFKIDLVCQPANSPDLNVNDLGFFRAIQSLQDDKMATTVEGLVQNVVTSFQELSSVTLNNVFLTLQGCLTEIMQAKGSNDYKIPHLNKARLLRLRMLPECIQVDEELLKDSLQHVLQFEKDVGTSYDIGALMVHFGFN